jgi:hypothetical protein
MALLRTTITTGATGAISDYNQAWKKLNQAWYDVKADYGATGNGSTDDTAAITACLAAAPAGSTIYFPPGTYLVSGSGNMFTLDKANIELCGSGIDTTTIKVKNSNGDFVRIFVSGGSGPANLHVHDLTFNSNVSNNTISSIATMMATKYRFVFDIDNAHGARFERVRFTDADCVGCLLFGDSDNVQIRNCTFDAIGAGAYHDHSCINVRGHGTRIQSNRFTGVGRSAWTAIELHGSDVVVEWNRVIDFARLGIVSGDTVNGYKNIWSHNEGIGLGDGIEIWAYDITGGSPTAPSVRDVIVTENQIDINYDPWATDMDRAEGINLQVGSTSCVERVKILNNQITYRTVTVATTGSTHVDSAGICFVRGGNIVLTGSGPADTDVDIRGNTIKGSISAGIVVEGWYPLWRLRISDNTIIDPGSGSVNSFYFKGITIWQPSSRGFALTDAVVSNNLVIDTRTTGKITGGVDTANVGYATGNRQFNNAARRHDATAVTAVIGNGGAAWATS